MTTKTPPWEQGGVLRARKEVKKMDWIDELKLPEEAAAAVRTKWEEGEKAPIWGLTPGESRDDMPGEDGFLAGFDN